MTTHAIEVTHPLYGQKGTHTAFCVCGWASEEQPTAGKATIAGWTHIEATRQRVVVPETREHPCSPTSSSEGNQ